MEGIILVWLGGVKLAGIWLMKICFTRRLIIWYIQLVLPGGNKPPYMTGLVAQAVIDWSF